MRAAERAVRAEPERPDSLMALAKAQVRFGGYDEAVDNAEQARRLHPLAPEYYPYVHGQALYADGRWTRRSGAGGLPAQGADERNCLRMQAASLVGQDRPIEARSAMTRLLKVEPGFSLAVERRLRRFGNSMEMQRYLSAPGAAGAPAGSGEAALARRPV